MNLIQIFNEIFSNLPIDKLLYGKLHYGKLLYGNIIFEPGLAYCSGISQTLLKSGIADSDLQRIAQFLCKAAEVCFPVILVVEIF